MSCQAIAYHHLNHLKVVHNTAQNSEKETELRIVHRAESVSSKCRTHRTTRKQDFRIYNPAVARFLSVDPLTKDYSRLSPYQYASNSPIANIDVDGLEKIYYTVADNNKLAILKTEDYLTIERNLEPSGLDGYNVQPPILLNFNPEELWIDQDKNQAEYEQGIAEQRAQTRRFYDAEFEFRKQKQLHNNPLATAYQLSLVKDGLEVYQDYQREGLAAAIFTGAIALFPEGVEIAFKSLKRIPLKSVAPQNGQKVKFNIQNGKISILDNQPKSGLYDFILTSDGKLSIGHGHFTLSNNGSEALVGAGRVYINRNGKIDYVDNFSGHYTPTSADLDQQTKVLSEAGLLESATGSVDKVNFSPE